jgi:hypothetical protein
MQAEEDREEIEEGKREMTKRIPADLIQAIEEMMARRVEREHETINELLPILHQAAEWIADFESAMGAVGGIEKQLGIEFSQIHAIRSAQDATDEQRAKLLAFAGSDGVYDICDILTVIGESKKSAKK